MDFDLEIETEKLAQLVAARAEKIVTAAAVRAGNKTVRARRPTVYLSTNVIQFPPERIVRAVPPKRRNRRPE